MFLIYKKVLIQVRKRVKRREKMSYNRAVLFKICVHEIMFQQQKTNPR